jgi:hypothetical protein
MDDGSPLGEHPAKTKAIKAKVLKIWARTGKGIQPRKWAKKSYKSISLSGKEKGKASIANNLKNKT